MAAGDILVYGTSWCGDCAMARRFLVQHGVAYRFINIDRDPAGRHYVEATNRGMRSVPTIVFADGSVLVEPSRTELAAQLGITEASIWQRLRCR